MQNVAPSRLEQVFPGYEYPICPDIYEEVFHAKASKTFAAFEDIAKREVLEQSALCPSEPIHFRMRCKFGLHADDAGYLHYAMYPRGGDPMLIEEFPVASKQICDSMPIVLEEINNSKALNAGIRTVKFLSTCSGQMLVTFSYDSPLHEGWQACARILKEKIHADIVGHARNQMVAVDRARVQETLSIAGRKLHYIQVEGSFSNPNAIVNGRALEWLLRVFQSVVDAHSGGIQRSTNLNLLELYCGNGNHTVALASLFARVVAVELNKKLCDAAVENLALNGVNNVDVVALPSEKFCQSILLEKIWTSPNGEGIEFDCVLVDPPRAGLDEKTLAAVAHYDYIVYISCNPVALRSNLEALVQTHSIEKIAAFDQFAYTDHIETGVVLRKKVQAQNF